LRRKACRVAADEPVDVVDEHDVVLRVATRAEVRTENLRHRCVFVVVWSSSGEVLVHERAPDKDIWPGRWDLGVGGVLGAGEGYADAAVRELAEEVGLEVAGPSALRELGRGIFDDDDVSLIGRIYDVVCDGPFTFADGEVVQAGFRRLAALQADVAADPGRWVPDSVAMVLPLLEHGPPPFPR
jgi:isopentenyldiphosphate isomerase